MHNMKTKLVNHKALALKFLRRFNEHGAKPGTVGYEIAKQYTIRAINLLIDELPGGRSTLIDYYSKIKEEVQNLK